MEQLSCASKLCCWDSDEEYASVASHENLSMCVLALLSPSLSLLGCLRLLKNLIMPLSFLFSDMLELLKGIFPTLPKT
jgi:hypothetical protein